MGYLLYMTPNLLIHKLRKGIKTWVKFPLSHTDVLSYTAVLTFLFCPGVRHCHQDHPSKNIWVLSVYWFYVSSLRLKLRLEFKPVLIDLTCMESGDEGLTVLAKFISGLPDKMSGKPSMLCRTFWSPVGHCLSSWPTIFFSLVWQFPCIELCRTKCPAMVEPSAGH